jgi:hypothetical protein
MHSATLPNGVRAAYNRRMAARRINDPIEPMTLGNGFTAETLGPLIVDGLATAAPGIMYAGNRAIEVTRLTISDLGRQAFAGT